MTIRDAITSAHAKTAPRDRFACGVSLRSSVWLRIRIQFLFPMDSAAVGLKNNNVQMSAVPEGKRVMNATPSPGADGVTMGQAPAWASAWREGMMALLTTAMQMP